MTAVVFILQWLGAAILLGLLVYMPGRLLLRLTGLSLNPPERMAVTLTGGAGLLVLVYWILSMLGVGYVLWGYAFIPGVVEAILDRREYQRNKNKVPDPEAPKPERYRDYAWLGLLILGGMLVQGRFTMFTGWPTESGIRLLAWHAHDAPWHVYNLFQLGRIFPPEMPGFSGQSLKNYHMFSDLLWGALLRLAPLNPWHIYFRVAPLFYSGLLTLTVFVAAMRWSGEKKVGYLAAAMTVFCSNFGYLMPLLFGADRYFIWESIFWVQPPMTNIFNPGVSSSFAFFMLGLWALTGWLRRKHGTGYLVLLALVWGVLPGFKVYPGILAIAGLIVTGVWISVFQRNHRWWIALAAVLPVFLLVFLPPNLHAPSLVRLLPGFNLAGMLVAPDRMAWMSPAQLKMLFAQKPALVAMIMAGLSLVFLIGNLGVRFIGLVPMAKTLFSPRKADPVLVFMTVVTGGAWAAPILFVQQGVQWNTIQFFYYAVLIAALPAAWQFWQWIGNAQREWRFAWIGVLFALGIPAAVQAWVSIDFHYASSAAVSEGARWLQAHTQQDEKLLRPLPDGLRDETGYANWLRSQERGRMTSMTQWRDEAKATAQTPAVEVEAPGDTLSALAVQPEPVAAAGNTETAQVEKGTAAWERTDVAAVAGLALRNTFLEDTVSSQIMGFDVVRRVGLVRDFYTSMDVLQAREFLEKETITYVILYQGMQLPFSPEGVPLKKVFENDAWIIFKHVDQGGW